MRQSSQISTGKPTFFFESSAVQSQNHDFLKEKIYYNNSQISSARFLQGFEISHIFSQCERGRRKAKVSKPYKNRALECCSKSFSL